MSQWWNFLDYIDQFDTNIIKDELQAFDPDKVVWDIEDLSIYFVSSDGNDFITIFLHALEMSKEINCDVEINLCKAVIEYHIAVSEPNQ